MRELANKIKLEISKYEDPNKAVFLQRFFKTGKGQYAEGDIFIGVNMPTIRKIANNFKDTNLIDIELLLESPIHEHRMCGLVIMVNQAKKAKKSTKRELYDLYLRRTDRINNWDLVDISCRDVVGGYLLNKPKSPLYKLAESDNLWERRIAIVSTWYFIKCNQLEEAFKISKILLNDEQDLIHKAVGWMLREAGKKDQVALTNFLDKLASSMPRTALRYSLEKLPPSLKHHYMSIKPKYTIA